MEQKMQTERGLLSVKELCQYLNIGTTLAYKLIKTPDFPTVRIGTRVYANKKYLDRWIENHMQQGGTDNE